MTFGNSRRSRRARPSPIIGTASTGRLAVSRHSVAVGAAFAPGIASPAAADGLGGGGQGGVGGQALGGHPAGVADRLGVALAEIHADPGEALAGDLSGQVDWAFQRTEAEYDVRKLGGVRAVINDISIRPQAKVEDVRARIRAAFERSAEIETTRISIDVVDGRDFTFIRCDFETNEDSFFELTNTFASNTKEFTNLLQGLFAVKKAKASCNNLAFTLLVY